ncbi:hypothetical protein ACFL35_05550 [Candidatus Riflebacteria bacterium]
MNNTHRAHFTLTEIIVMTALATLVLLVLVKVLSSGMRGAQHGIEKLVALNDLSFFIKRFQADVRNITKIININNDEISFRLSRFSKSLKRSVRFEATYKVKKGSNKKLHIKFIPKALGSSSLPAEIKPKKFFNGNLEKFKFLNLKKDEGITLPDKQVGFAVKVKLMDKKTGAKINFRRAFFPPLVYENNPEDPYRSLYDL